MLDRLARLIFRFLSSPKDGNSARSRSKWPLATRFVAAREHKCPDPITSGVSEPHSGPRAPKSIALNNRSKTLSPESFSKPDLRAAMNLTAEQLQIASMIDAKMQELVCDGNDDITILTVKSPKAVERIRL
jgi:hypothetical protein